LGTVANLSVRITAKTSEFEKSLKSMEGQWNRVGGKMQSIGATLTKSITLPMVAGAAAALKFSSDFEAAMTKTVTLAGESKASMEAMRGSVLALSKETGVGPVALAEALVAIESNGLTGSAALEVLTASAKSSAIGMGEAADVGRALTAVVNAYGTDTLTATQAADQFHQIVLLGGAEANTLAGELGRVVGVASALGVSFAEVGAFIATYTRLGLSASEATTGLSGVLNMILNPSREARDALGSLGMSAESLRQQVSEQGLGTALTGLIGKLKGNADATGALFGNVRALAGVMGTAGTQAQAYRDNLEKIKNSTGSLSAAFKVWEGTTAATWAKFTAGAQSALVVIGDQLAPAFSRMLQAAMPLLDAVVKLVDWFSKLPQPVQTTALALAGIAAAAGPVTFAIGGLMKTGGALLGLLKLIPGATAAAGSGWALLTNPITGVVAAIGAVLYALKQLTGSWTRAFSILMPPVGFLMSAWQQVADKIKYVRALLPGGTGTPEAPGGPGMAINAPLGPVQDITAAIALLDQTATKAGVKPGGGGSGAPAKKSPLAQAIEGIQDRMKAAVVDAKAWASEVERQGGLDKATAYAKSQLGDALDEVVKQYGSLEAAGLGAMRPILAETQKVLESTRAIANEIAMLAGPKMGVLRSTQNTIGSGALGGSLGQYHSLQGIANQAGMGGAPTVEGKDISGDVAVYARDQMVMAVDVTVDAIVSAVQKFASLVSPGLGAALGGLMGAFQKFAASGKLDKLLGKGMGAKAGAALGIGIDAFGSGFGLGESFGTGKGALAGAGMGAATGAMMGSVVPVIGTAVGAVVGGIAGLIGGIFGGKKKKREEQAKMAEVKGQLLEQFGGMAGLEKAAGLAGVSVTQLFATDNAKLFKSELDKVTAAIEEMQKRVATTIGDIDKVMAEGGQIGKDLWANILKDKDADEIKAKLSEVFDASVARTAEGFGKIAANFELLKRPLNEIGVLAEASFAGLLAGGASIPEAIGQMAEGLAHIQELMSKSGETATGPLATLLNYQAIAEANQGLFTLLSGVDDMLTGLGNSGLLTQERFAALGATISQAFGQLQAQGVAGTTALEMMQPQLQKLWEAQQMFGLQTDAATQALLEQAVQQGIVGENMKAVDQQILDVLKAIAVALGAEIPGALAALPGHAQNAAAGVTNAFESIPDIRVGVSADWSGFPAQPGGPTGGTGLKPMATGGIVTRPTAALIGESGPEAVIPLDEWRESASVNVTVHGTADREFAKLLARQISLGGDVRTAWQGALN
jgi:TP901 family phage tail tape measure protein